MYWRSAVTFLSNILIFLLSWSGDGHVWLVTESWASKYSWSLVLSWLTAVSPVHLPLRGTLFATSESPKQERHRGIGHPHHTLPSQTPPAHRLTLTSPRGSEQQPPWCCHKDREMNCECLDVNMWVCRLITHANKNSHVDKRACSAHEEAHVLAF